MKQQRTHTLNATTTPHSHSQRWLLAHDIRDPRRLQRVWRYLSQEGVRLQYSVYLLPGTRQQIEKVLDKLRTLIDEQADDVRVYPLNDNTRIWGLGTQFDDNGNALTDAFMDKLIQNSAKPTSSAFGNPEFLATDPTSACQH